MIIDRVILDNFGAYAGSQEAILTPEQDKPVVLFGGMNGGGKTTLLDSIQLGFYGAKARTSNRGRLAYKEYLAECINRSADPADGASITIQFQRTVDGGKHDFSVQRRWFHNENGEIEENLHVCQDGEPDEILTEHWEEYFNAYLPVQIAHLFFFDGEQIAELAESKNASKIIGAAIHSLLGLDLVERLETDLKVFERRKRTEEMDDAAQLRLASAEKEVEALFEEQGRLKQEHGRITNEAGRLAETKREAEEDFRSEGGELFLKRKDLEREFKTVETKKDAIEKSLRELAAGPLPLALITPLLEQTQKQAFDETAILQAKVLSESLAERDEKVLSLLKKKKVGTDAVAAIGKELSKDRKAISKQAEAPIIIGGDAQLPHQIGHLLETVLPAAQADSEELLHQLATADETIARLESELARIPDEDRIAETQTRVEQARAAHDAKLAEKQTIEVRKKSIARELEIAKKKLKELEIVEKKTIHQAEDRARFINHSSKVRDTLEKFRERVVAKHVRKMEALMLESFQRLLRKTNLVTRLTIDPKTFHITLFGKNDAPLPFDRLSAGERQLLATSLLWGLARASGRPVPTIIDTPLGRLDSSHRKHLTERYFPDASHQVLLLSTDEEIVGDYHSALKRYTCRSYLLAHDEKQSVTSIETGYFNAA